MDTTSKSKYQTLVVDPPWQFRRASRCVRPPYSLLNLEDIKRFPVAEMAADDAHLYLWVPNAMISEGYEVMKAWGFEYKTMIVWIKLQMGVGNFYRNSTEPILFGVRGHLKPLRRNARTWFLADRREHSRKPDEFYRIVETMSPGPRIDVFSREKRPGWDQLGNECDYFSPEGQKEEDDERVTVSDTERGGGTTGSLEANDIRLDQRPEDPLP